ncbi:MAG: hypothetical protein U0R64_00300 [Candidatus Nanopelagicales bacterium]
MILALPWVRAAATGGLIATAGTVAHRVAGAHEVSMAAVTAVAVMAILTVRLVQGAAGSFLRTAGLLAGGQLLIHLLLGVGHGGVAGHVHGVTAAAGHHDGLRRSAGAVGPQFLAGVGDAIAALAQQPSMVAAHVVAALVIGLWLTGGERAAVAVLSMLAAVIRAVLPEPVPVGVPSALPTLPARVRAFSSRFARAGGRRGPPASLSALAVPV